MIIERCEKKEDVKHDSFSSMSDRVDGSAATKMINEKKKQLRGKTMSYWVPTYARHYADSELTKMNKTWLLTIRNSLAGRET